MKTHQEYNFLMAAGDEDTVESKLREVEERIRRISEERRRGAGTGGREETVRGEECECPDFLPWGPFEETWLPVLVASDMAPAQMSEADQAVVLECLGLSVRLLNERVGREVFLFAGNRPAVLPEAASPHSVLLYVTLDLKTKAHGITDLFHDRHTGRASCSVLPQFHQTQQNNKKKKKKTVAEKGASSFVRGMSTTHPCIRMQIRPKPEVQVEQRRRQYVSTMTHEMLHGIGFGHIRGVTREMMSVATGGVCICRHCPWPPVLKSSPITTTAFRWLYSPHSQLFIAEFGGFPIHCAHCFAIGWRWC